MRIALSADPLLPVPPRNYGGIERIISFLAEGLVQRGHEVILCAHRESTVNVPVVNYSSLGTGVQGVVRNLLTVGQLSDWKPDVVHSFSRLAYLLPLLVHKVPKIMSYQREPTLSQIKKACFLARANSLSFTGCSDYITNQIKPIANAETVYNGVELVKYNCLANVSPDAPLIFLGRIEPIKGTHHAVATAKQTGRRLIIAGNVPNEHTTYFKKQIAPSLGSDIEYVGPVDDLQKNELLGNSAALLMPVEWNEPFGIVMVEAMACGTPVIGFDRGAVPEVIIHKATGYRCNNVSEMVTAVKSLDLIDRRNVRAHCARLFSSEVIIHHYIRLYQSMLD